MFLHIIASLKNTSRESADKTQKLKINILLNILSYADGKHDILDIANIINYELSDIINVLQICLTQKLIKPPR